MFIQRITPPLRGHPQDSRLIDDSSTQMTATIHRRHGRGSGIGDKHLNPEAEILKPMYSNRCDRESSWSSEMTQSVYS